MISKLGGMAFVGGRAMPLMAMAEGLVIYHTLLGVPLAIITEPNTNMKMSMERMDGLMRVLLMVKEEWRMAFFSYFLSGNPNVETSPLKGNFFTHSGLNANQQLLDNTSPDNSIQQDTYVHCPYPPSFMNKRQQELFNYWGDLMKVEDIFEFSDINSHRFGKVMAEFLGVYKILDKRNPSASHLTASSTRTSVPVIYENETSGLGAAVSHHVFATPAMSGPTLRDMDDESTLSDDNFIVGYNRKVHAKRIPCNGKRLVDVVPNLEFINGDVATSDSDHNILYSKVCVDAPRVMDTINDNDSLHRRQSSSKKLGARRGQKGVKPAFQRRFLVP
mmetsp:Transcript_13262/g.28125  ORF Transcript_13262/g.28125 Transcript_13262/m.28125 type:complete len:332 (+) Transcript_13262:539-1534(+)